MSEHVELTEWEVEKSGWPPGPWHDEPDRLQWNHAGFACLMVRQSRMGHWCGYVGVPEEHPFFGHSYHDIDEDVHGGLTYSEVCDPPVCHVPEPGFPDRVWWLGFDCGHADDRMPAMSVPWGVYRDVEYVQAETNKLAQELQAAQEDN